MRLLFTLIIGISVLFGGQTSAQALLLDHVDGLVDDTCLATDMEITFHIRLQTDSFNIKAISNGYRVYSDDGAEWTESWGEFTDGIDSSLMPMQFVTPYSTDGVGADTIGYAAFTWIDIEPGLPPGFDEIVYTLSIGPISQEFAGSTICLDSSFFRPGNLWTWIVNDGGNTPVYPSWDGPHCYEVHGADCCVKRGDINHDGVGPLVDDLIMLTAYLVDGYPVPPCLEEADVDGDGAPISEIDMLYMMNYMFSRTCQVPMIVPCGGSSAADKAVR